MKRFTVREFLYPEDSPLARLQELENKIEDGNLVEVETTTNVGTYHPVDEFICSKCGIQLEEWVRHVTDEDGEEYHYEYEFNFCPNCGRRIEEEQIEKTIRELMEGTDNG